MPALSLRSRTLCGACGRLCLRRTTPREIAACPWTTFSACLLSGVSALRERSVEGRRAYKIAIAGMASHKRLPWRCKVCGKRNGPNDVKCLGCRRPKPEPKPEPKLPKPKPKPKLRELETQLFARRGGKGLAAPSRRAIEKRRETGEKKHAKNSLFRENT